MAAMFNTMKYFSIIYDFGVVYFAGFLSNASLQVALQNQVVSVPFTEYSVHVSSFSISHTGSMGPAAATGAGVASSVAGTSAWSAAFSSFALLHAVNNMAAAITDIKYFIFCILMECKVRFFLLISGNGR